MSPSAAKSFTAVLEPLRSRLNWVIARIPFDVSKAWPERRGLLVRGKIVSVSNKTGGFAFRTSLFSSMSGDGHFLLVNKKMLAAAKAAVGSQVKISLEPDLEERVAAVPPELARALKGDRRLPKWFAKLSYSNRKEVAAWITEPKSAEGRKQRAERMAERLLLTLEGEIDPPPILQAAFLRQPLARKGWEAMTATQRRGHLLGIFRYQSVESRERRAAKAVEEALRVARRGSRVSG
ncbi:MAG: YdeI/OmpD-associated family protein [Terracidiphilus sp.]